MHMAATSRHMQEEGPYGASDRLDHPLWMDGSGYNKYVFQIKPPLNPRQKDKERIRKTATQKKGEVSDDGDDVYTVL